MDKAIVVRPCFEPGRRIIAVSDIHGNLPFFLALMEKIRLTPDDILVLAGDMLEKGKDSLPLLRHLMALSQTHTLYPICGNCDGLVLRFFDTDELDERFFSFYLPRHPESTLRQLAREAGFDQTEDLPRLRQDLRAAFPEEWAWLRAMPTILETGHLVFVHGGVPSLQGMEELDRWTCMKNDGFLDQGFTFHKWVIVGHWPVTLYDAHIPSSAPLILRDRKIISIDGACVLKVDGQLNALILPSEDSEDFTWTAWDGLPTAVALDPQRPNSFPVNIRWGRAELELLEEGRELSLCRHLETGRELYILTEYLRRRDGKLWCEDSTDYRLPVSPGDRLTVVRRIQGGALCKKDGVTGWYFGRLSNA
ncbi:MAG: serine/threonine protein phosphatase [Lawsonibacter sp.]|nr:serine/threonine protein phosphatase [Lawsonibacter sp.]